jgi:hypothetical protein
VVNKQADGNSPFQVLSCDSREVICLARTLITTILIKQRKLGKTSELPSHPNA